MGSSTILCVSYVFLECFFCVKYIVYTHKKHTRSTQEAHKIMLEPWENILRISVYDDRHEKKMILLVLLYLGLNPTV